MFLVSDEVSLAGAFRLPTLVGCTCVLTNARLWRLLRRWCLYVAICYTIKWIQKKKTARRVSTSGAAQNEHNVSGVHPDNSIIQVGVDV